MTVKKGKARAKPVLKRNDQGMPGWNVYFNGRVKKITFYPEAECFYFELQPEGDKDA